MSRDVVSDENGSLLAHVLLSIVLIELAIHRLAVPALRPVRDKPPSWHISLAWIGNFLFYFAFAFALALIAREIGRVLAERDRHPRWFAYALMMAGGLLAVAITTSVIFAASEQLTFVLDACFTLALVVIVIRQVPPGGDLGARVGIVLLALPLILHFYAPFALRYISGDDLGLPDRVQVFGQWSLVFSALATPYCFAPRPFTSSAARLPPMLVAMFVTVLAAIIIRRAAEVGMDLARDGLGVALDPLAPVSMLALYIMALAAVTWTLVSCLSAPAMSRRMIGVGIGLILLGGYGFEWPLQYLLGFLGLLFISNGARRVDGEERSKVAPPPINHGVAISDDLWQQFVARLGELVSAERADGANPSLLTVNDEDGAARTHVVWSEGELRVRLSLIRRNGHLQYIDYLAGEEPGDGEEPSWTLWARSIAGARSAHPAPPVCSGAATRFGNEAFDARFQMRDAGGLGQKLLPDSSMRESAVRLLAGWVALWPGAALRHRMLPGVGTPRDRPIDAARLESPEALAVVGEFLALLGAMAANGVEP